jgi:hypothetical protein
MKRYRFSSDFPRQVRLSDRESHNAIGKEAGGFPLQERLAGLLLHRGFSPPDFV